MPTLPQPFTIPIAAARLLEFQKKISLQHVQFEYPTYAGGRGIAFETHTSVIADPFSNDQLSRIMILTGEHN